MGICGHLGGNRPELDLCTVREQKSPPPALDQLATREEANRTKISDQSKLLYAEAFGSINLGKDAGDTGAEDVVDLRRQAEMLTEQMADKDNEVESLRLEVEKLQDEVKQARSEVEEADGYNFTMVEESKNLVEEAKNHARELEQKDAVIRDCRAYIDSLTDQVNARSEELEDAQEKLLKFDQIQEEVEQMQEQIEVKQSEMERLGAVLLNPQESRISTQTIEGFTGAPNPGSCFW